MRRAPAIAAAAAGGIRTGAGRELKPRLRAANRPSPEGSTSTSPASGSAQRQLQPLRLAPFKRDLAVVQDLDSSSEGSRVLADVSLMASNPGRLAA
jgi:hypothetical protein